MTAPFGPAPSERAPAELPKGRPESIGPYPILSLLGEGGMGAVYEAEQTDPRRRVALEVLRVALASREARRRFALEGEILGCLRRPCVAQVYAMGSASLAAGVDVPYLAMEHIAGARDLGRYVLETSPSLEERLELFCQVVDGVEHAHQQGIVHRDNDFEVFVDPEGDGRWYGEVEVNALGTVFDLGLDRPYEEGGHPYVDWSPAGLRAAVAVDGTLGDPTDEDRGCTVEIAIPHAALAEHASALLPPHPGDVWRMNFSRVPWSYDLVEGRYVKRPDTREDNWVWTPQFAVTCTAPSSGGSSSSWGTGSGARRGEVGARRP